MTAQRIDGRAISAEIRAEVARDVEMLSARGAVPGLAFMLVGDDPASLSYVTAKSRACEETGIRTDTLHLPASTPQREVLERLEALNEDEQWHSILVQLPLPDHIDPGAVLESIRPTKDVDGLHPANLGRLLRGDTSGPLPCTPAGIIELLLRTGNDPAGKHAVVVGRSTLVGRPVAMLLSNKGRGGNATVTICHTATKDLAAHTRDADILIAAAGRPGTITGDMVRPGAVVIDVGTNRIDDPSRERGWRLVGDVEHREARDVASWITPVPGGVGPMTIAMLLVNTVSAARRSIVGD